MNEKINLFRVIGIVIIAVIFSGAVSAGFCIIFNSKNKSDNRGIGEYQQRERQLLDRIGEFERREEDRNRREAERIRAEGERIERTETAINAIRQSNRRERDLYAELRAQNNILEDYFRDSVHIHSNDINNIGNE